MRRSILMALTLALGAALAITPAEAQYKPEFKNSLVTNDQTAWGVAATKFADLLRERTQGRINVKNYWSGQLFAGKQTNEFALLNQGVADFPPPVAVNLYVAANVARLRFETIAAAVWPFVAAMVLALIVVILFPSLSTWLPAVFGLR